MKRLLLMAMASGLAIVAATPATAAIFIGTRTGTAATINAAAINQVATGSGSVNYNTTDANGYFFNVSATGFPLMMNPSLLTQSVNIQGNGASQILDLYITQTDQATFSGSLLSAFTSNTISGATVEVTSYYSTTNAVFAGTQLQDTTFTSGPATFSGVNGLGTVASPWSETVRYRLTFNGGGNFNGTANISAAVPEPATWGMMIAGFGLLGGVMRRRRTSVAFA